MSFKRIQQSTDQIVIEKSRFIGYGVPVSDEADAEQQLLKIKKEHADARHVCYAYVLDGTVNRCNDDGEPSGTAGLPILSAINNANLKYSLIAVVRYFGGIKLGTGGLYRAYSQSAKNVAEKNDEYDFFNEFIVTADYSAQKNILHFAQKALCKVGETTYNQNISIPVYCSQDIQSDLQKLTGVISVKNNGKILLKIEV